MWNQYLKKTIIVRALEEEHGYESNPVTFTVLDIKQTELNEMALVSSVRGDVYWAYTSRYIVMSVEEDSFPDAGWYEHIGKSLLVEDNGIILEVIPIKTRGNYCLGKFKWLGFNDGSCRWFNISEYTIVN